MKKKQKSIAIALSFIFLMTLIPVPFKKVVHAETGATISKIAGTTVKVGVSGYSGDNGLSTGAQLNRPVGLATDSSGNLYIADSSNNAIRKIDSAGNISTIAGTGPASTGPGMFPGFPGLPGSSSQYSGDNGLATSAKLNNPRGVAVGSNGNLYIADSSNNAIRKIDDTTKNISTIAGTGPGMGGYFADSGVATSIQLNSPQGVAVDSSGNLYIADTWSNKVRKVNITTGNMSTIAGTGSAAYSGDNGLATSAQLKNPTAVVLDSSENIYIADAGNNRIRKIDNATGNISTIAGTGTAGYNGDNVAATSAQLNNPIGIALDSSKNVYIADNLNNRIRKIDNTTGNISTIAGTGTAGYDEDNGSATSVELNEPTGVAVDSSGNVYIADNFNSVIRKIDHTGNISTIAGLSKYVPAGGYSGDDGLATSAKLYGPIGVAVDGNKNVYIADSQNNRIRKIDNTGNISTVAGTGTGGYGGDDGLATSAELYSPQGVAVDSSGNLYIADSYNNRIRKIDSTGNISTIAGTGTGGYSGDNGAAISAELNSPMAVAVDNIGNIYIADARNNRVRKIDKDTKNISTIAGTGTSGYSGDGGLAASAQLSMPAGVAVDVYGNVYIADRFNNRIRKIDKDTKNINTITASNELNSPQGISVDSSGNVYVADYMNSRIRKIDKNTGTITTIAGTGIPGYNGDDGLTTSIQLNYPSAVAVDLDGNVYISDTNNSMIRKISMPTSSYTVTYDGNGNTDGTLPADSTSYSSGTSVTAKTAGDLVRDGYRFIGWNTAKDGTGTAVAEGGNFNITGSTTLYAQWNKIVPASGLTVTVEPEATPVQGKVNLTVTPGAEDNNHTILYRITEDSVVPNVGDEIEPGDGWIEVRDANAHEVTVPNDLHIEAVEVTNGNYKVTKWGKSNVTNDGYIVSASLSRNTANFDKNTVNQADISVDMTLNGNRLTSITNAGTPLVINTDYIVNGDRVTISKNYLKSLEKGTTANLVFNFNAGSPQSLSVTITDTTPVAASGLTVTTAAEAPAVSGKVNLTVTPAAEDSNHKVYYKVVDSAPTALNVGDEITLLQWTEVTDANAHEITVPNGKYIEAVEVTTANNKVTRWGKYGTTNDGYILSARLITNIANFDKNISNQEDINVGMVLNGNMLRTITNGEKTLISGTDYTANDDIVTISKSYLAKLSTGTTQNLVFNFSAGSSQNLSVTISDSTPSNASISPIAANFDKNTLNQADVNVGMTISQNTLTSITNTGTSLIAGMDYTIGGNTVSIKKSSLGKLTTGTSTVLFNSNAGNSQSLTSSISVSEAGVVLTMKLNGKPLTSITNEGNTLVNGIDYIVNGDTVTIKRGLLTKVGTGTVNLVFNFDTENLAVTMLANETAVNVTMALNENSLKSITNGEYILVKGIDYTVNGAAVRISKNYLSNLRTGAAVLVFNFSEGSPQNLNISIIDTTSYTVTFQDYNGNTIGIPQTVNRGGRALAPVNPTRAGYTFTGWDRAFDNVTGNLVVTAQYSINRYTVTFKNYDGSTIGAPQTVNYGGNASAPANPTRTGYTFTGWDKTFDNVTGNLVVTAQYSINRYTVTFKDYDGSTIGAPQTVNYGGRASAPGAPTRTGYTFTGWDKAFDNVTGNLVVTAQYSINGYTVTFKNYDGSTIGTPQTVNYGGRASAPSNPTRAGYTFTGWDKTFDNVTGSLVVTAQYLINNYTVTFKDYDGSTIGTPQTVNYGGKALAPEVSARTGYTFTGWDKAFDNVTGNLVVTAQYSINRYTVTFKDYNGDAIGAPQTVNYGEKASAPVNPTRTGYIFAGWDKAFDNVKEDLVVTATYTSGNTYDFPSNTSSSTGGNETKISTDYLKSRDNTLVINNSTADLSIPASAIDLTDEADHIKVTEKVVTSASTNNALGLFSNIPNGRQMVGNPLSLNIQLFDANDKLIKDIHQFANNQKVKVTIKLTADQVKGLDTSKLSMYYYDEANKEWVELGGTFDPNSMEFTFYTPHFTNFAIMQKVTAASTSTNASSNSTIKAAGNNANSEKELPKTGSIFDFYNLLAIGVILIASGIAIFRRRKIS